MAKTTAADFEKMSFEDALGELEKTVRQLEGGSAPLKDSIDTYERGVALKKICETRLKEAQMKIEKISVSADGHVSTSPFSATE